MMQSAVLGRSVAAAAALPLGRSPHSWAIASDGSVWVAGRPGGRELCVSRHEAFPKQEHNAVYTFRVKGSCCAARRLRCASWHA